MTKFSCSLLILTFINSFAQAAILVNFPSSKGGTEERLIEIQPLQTNSESLAIYEFSPKGYDRNRITEWVYSRTLLVKTNAAELRDYVTEFSPTSLDEICAKELLGLQNKKTEQAKKDVGPAAVSVLARSAAPALLFSTALFKSFSFESLQRKAIQYTHPFLILLATEKTKIYVEDSKYLDNLESEIQALQMKKHSLFEVRFQNFKEKDLQQALLYEKVVSP